MCRDPHTEEDQESRRRRQEGVERVWVGGSLQGRDEVFLDPVRGGLRGDGRVRTKCPSPLALVHHTGQEGSPGCKNQGTAKVYGYILYALIDLILYVCRYMECYHSLAMNLLLSLRQYIHCCCDCCTTYGPRPLCTDYAFSAHSSRTPAEHLNGPASPVQYMRVLHSWSTDLFLLCKNYDTVSLPPCSHFLLPAG